MTDYNCKVFSPVSISNNGAADLETRFMYKQVENIVTCEYNGTKIKSGHLIAIVQHDGSLDMRYHQVNSDGVLMTGHAQVNRRFAEWKNTVA